MRPTVRFSVLLTGLVLAGCAADKLHREGLHEIGQGGYEQGVAKLREAVQKDPHNLDHRMALRTQEETLVRKLLDDAEVARGNGLAAEAEATYRRVLAIDSRNDRALRGIEAVQADARHADAVAAARKAMTAGETDRADALLRNVLAEDPNHVAAREMRAAADRARGPVIAPTRLKTRDGRPVTLQLRDANTKMVFELLSRQTGINFIFDKDVKTDGKTTIYVHDVPVESAIDLVLAQNGLARQVMAPNMVMIHPNTPAKAKEYEAEVVRTFYLKDADPKQVQTLVRTIVNPKAMYVDDRSGVLVVRDTPEVLRMAERLIESVDLPEAEVMLEVEVLEITKSRVQQLGVQYPGSVTLTPTSATGGTGLKLDDLRRQNSSTIGVSSLSATLNALAQNGLSNTLASPRIRARNHEKAKILIGQRVPVITNTVTPTTTQAVVTGSVQYLDVGLTLDVEPTIHRDGEVAIKLGLEVSSIINQVTTPSGTVAYQIGTRNASTLLQLRDGETQVLAGLIQDTDTRGGNAIPGLGDMPLLGRLFGSTKSDKQKSEVVLAVTPRIVRGHRRPDGSATEFWYGTESSRGAPVGVSVAPETAAAPAVQSAPVAPVAPAVTPTPAATTAPVTATRTPGSQSTVRTVVQQNPRLPTATPVQAAPVAQAAAETAPAAAADADAPLVSWDAPSDVAVGQEFTVLMNVSGQTPVTRWSAHLTYDASSLELIGYTPGSGVAGNTPRVDLARGSVTLQAQAAAGNTLSPTGALLSLQFRATNPRAAAEIMAQLSAAAQGGTQEALVQPLALAIR